MMLRDRRPDIEPPSWVSSLSRRDGRRAPYSAGDSGTRSTGGAWIVPIDTGDRESAGWFSQARERADQAADRYQRLARSRPLLGLPLAFAARYTGRQGILLASAVAFRLFLWLVPLALVLAGILAAYATGGDRDATAAVR